MKLPAAPLFVQALGLVIATLVAAEIATIIVVLNLPPPTPDVYAVQDVAQALRHPGRTQTRDGRDLMTRLAIAPPAANTEGHRRLQFRAALAAVLAIDPARIVISQPGPRLVVFAASPGPRRGPPRITDVPILFGAFDVGVRQPSGRWLVAAPVTAFGIDPWQQRLLLVLAIAALAISPLAWWFARRLAAPISALAAGAERLGRDPKAPPLPSGGPPEVRAAVRAFNEMQQRLAQYVEDRTQMTAAIAHDLRTPLTRMRFRIEAAPDDLREKMAADIDQMDAMIAATLAFVREESRPAQRVRLEIASLVETIFDEAAETGAEATAGPSARVVVDGDPLALRRLIANLVENAVKFGGRAHGRVFLDGETAVVEISDDGPGIPPDQIERAFEPFHRLEGSRSRDTGGIGLGLAVARAIARAHGGDISLTNLASRGLCARLRLPLAYVSGSAGVAPTS